MWNNSREKLLYFLFWRYLQTIVKPLGTINYAEMKRSKNSYKGKNIVKKKEEAYLEVLRTLPNNYNEAFLRK